MTDSPPHSNNHDKQQFTIGVTRVCLASGTLQIPFAMRGILEPGTYRAHDVELDEKHELAFEPPRSLSGLDAIFVAHELQPNDEVILTSAEDGFELKVRKRPRRKAPQMKGEPWESVRGSQAGAAQRPPAPRELPREPGASANSARTAPARGAEEDGRVDARAGDRPAGRPAALEDDPDAPRIVRARRLDTGRSETGRPDAGRPETGRSARAGERGGAPRARGKPASSRAPEAPRREATPEAGHEHGRVRERIAPSDRDHAGRREHVPEPRESAAKRFYDDSDERYEDSGFRDEPHEADALDEGIWAWERSERTEPAPRERAELQAQQRGQEQAQRQGEGILARIARTVEAAKGAFSFRGAEREDEYVEEDDHIASQHEVEPEPYRYMQVSPADAQDRDRSSDWVEDAAREAEGNEGPRGDLEPAGGAAPRASAPRGAPGGPQDARPEPPTSQPASQPPAAAQRQVVIEDADADAMDRQGPPMWDVGEGDLRQRLIRFLQHPDVPVILRAEMVARNFGLGNEVADAMLEDLTNDKVDGLVVTRVRDETYRISRAPTKL